MTRKTFEIEIQRNNVTPAQFLAYVRKQVDNKGGWGLRSDLDLDYFRRGDDMNFDSVHKGDDEPDYVIGLREKSVSHPYEMQTYLRYANGAVYNEICEFSFDDEKTGHGYYYLVNVEAIEAETGRDLALEITRTANLIDEENATSAWDKGVKAYAVEMLKDMAFNAEHGYVDVDAFSNRTMLRNALLNGADDWSQYSWGGCALIYDGDIAERLCTPSELKRYHGGERRPNAREEWLDVQARALFQASNLILDRMGD